MSVEWRFPSSLPSAPLSALLLGFGVTWGCYYLHYICKRPRLVAAGPVRRFLESHCPVVRTDFRPTFWCVGGRVQTIFRVLLLTRPRLSYRNEMIGTPDGGQISLDWSDNEDSAHFPESSSRPTVLLLPGLTGNSQQSYIRHFIRQACRDGYRCVVFNNRGFGGEELLTHRTFSGANTEDLSRVVEHVRSRFPGAPLLAVGISLGGMVLLNYLASSGSRSQLRAALVFSTPWDVFVSTESLERPLNYFLFNRNLVSGLRKTVLRYRHIIEKVLDVDHILQSRSIREFDERYTSIAFGYQSCDDYYQHASPCTKLGKVRTPVLCVNAEDDPFSPQHGCLPEEAKGANHIQIRVTNKGSVSEI
ncbi:LOW QUALITY PROTEIN: protein ABHD1 [Mantella aurantiaca]